MKLKEKTTSILNKIHNIVLKIKRFIKENDVELTMLIGLFLISYATYKINFIAFLYVVGLIFIAFSVYLLKFPSQGGDK